MRDNDITCRTCRAGSRAGNDDNADNHDRTKLNADNHDRAKLNADNHNRAKLNIATQRSINNKRQSK